MNIYLIATRSNKQELKRAKKIADYLEDLNYTVDRSMLDRSFEDEEKMGPVKTYELINQSMRNCDLMIVEVTNYSPGIGFYIATAHAQGKQVLCLHWKDSGIMPSIALRSVNSPGLTFHEYKKEELEDYLKDFLKKAEKSLKKRFIMTIDADIARYLDWVVANRGGKKSDIVRKSARSMMERTDAFQAYLKQ